MQNELLTQRELEKAQLEKQKMVTEMKVLNDVKALEKELSLKDTEFEKLKLQMESGFIKQTEELEREYKRAISELVDQVKQLK